MLCSNTYFKCMVIPKVCICICYIYVYVYERFITPNILTRVENYNILFRIIDIL